MASLLAIAAFIVSLILFAIHDLTATGQTTTRVTIAEKYLTEFRKQEPSMLPKDLLNYLEKGDRTLEDLKSNHYQIEGAFPNVSSWPSQAYSQQNQMAAAGQFQGLGDNAQYFSALNSLAQGLR